MKPAWHVYIVRTRDGSLYTGITTDVARRVGEHGADTGRGARSLRGRGPLEVVYSRRLGELGLALRVEAWIKRRPKHEKESIVASRPTRRTLVARLGPGERRVAAVRAAGRRR